MLRRTTSLVIGASVLAGLGAFLFTVSIRGAALRAQRPPLARWLGLSAQQAEDVAKADPAFEKDAEALKADLHASRLKLASLLEDPDATSDQITGQVETVIAAQDKLTRRVTKHLLAIRPILAAEQQKQLMGLCAEGVREAAQWRWRGGADGGEHPGRRGPPWQEDAGGRGRGRRGGGDNAPGRGQP